MPPTPLSSGAFYQRWLGPVLANDDGLDAEQMSRAALTALAQASQRRRWPVVATVLDGLARDLQRRDLRLEQVLFGCRFANPVGLAAGFDKNGVAAGIWDRFGFGFAEVGTVTWHGQPGNPRPRLFRLAEEQAALNRMGFNNDGAQALLKTLDRQRLDPPGRRPAVLGINVGKSKITPLEQAPEDYAASLELLAPFADYAVVNVSSPNTPGLRDLQSVQSLRPILAAVLAQTSTPVLVKIAPDLADDDIDQIADLAVELGLAGIVATNTTISRDGLATPGVADLGPGGISGPPVARRAAGSIDMRAALAAMHWSRGEEDEAERDWNWACEKINSGVLTEGGPALDGCALYRDRDWLGRIRRWPPSMVSKMDDFIRLRKPSNA